MRVATVQFCPQFKAFEANLATMVKMTLEAVQGGAQLIVLPELATTGYSFMSTEEVEPFAEALDGNDRVTKGMLKLAQQNNVAIAWGMPAKDIGGSPKLYNAQVLVLPNGKWVRYFKINQWGNDFLWSAEGTTSPPIVEFMEKKIGLLICRDVRDKSDAMKFLYEKGDADIVCFSANFGDGGFPSISWVDFAKNNEVWFIVSNRYGQEANNDFGEGGICVISPKGKVHCKGLVWSQPCIVYTEIP
jgi:predicted amidohydrolase